MTVASVVMAVVAAVVAYLASKGVVVPPHDQAIAVAGLTMFSSWFLPVLVRWENAHAREVGAILGAVAVGLQLLLSSTMGGEAQAILSALLVLVTGLGLPAAAQGSMPYATVGRSRR